MGTLNFSLKLCQLLVILICLFEIYLRIYRRLSSRSLYPPKAGHCQTVPGGTPLCTALVGVTRVLPEVGTELWRRGNDGNDGNAGDAGNAAMSVIH